MSATPSSSPGAWVERVVQLVEEGDWIHINSVNGYVRSIQQIHSGGSWERHVFTLDTPFGPKEATAYAGTVVKVWEA